MSLEHILLGSLASPASGYDLKANFEAGARHFWFAELSQIYPTLRRMEQRGWLTSATEPSSRGPARRVYTRTRSGTAELKRWLRSGPIVGVERFAYIGQLVLMGQLDDLETTLAFMQRLRKLLREKLQYLKAAEKEMADEWDGYPDDLGGVEFHEHLSLRMGIVSLNAKVRWCDESIKQVLQRMERDRSDD